MYDENNQFYLSAKDKAILQKCVYENPYIPFSPFPKQAEMILATEKEVLIGGAAGGSKSTSLLMRALFYVQDDVNEYHALILRRTLSDLKRKGALIHKASQWLNRKEIQNNSAIKPKWDGTEHSWTFPNGNSLTFGYLRNINDLDTYQGSEYQFIGIDELTQLERFKYIYMRSRVRKTKDNKLPTQLMASSNPGKRGNKWVRERFIEKIDEDIQDKSQIRFISSSYLDNIYLDRNDYEEYLMGLDRVTRKSQYVNGQLVSGVVDSTTNLKPAVNRIIVKGDKYAPNVADLSYWQWPTDRPYTITSYFEYRWGSFHNGIDIYVGYGAPVYAANNGVVQAIGTGCTPGYLGCNGRQGNYILINHNAGGYYTVYMHLKDIYVSQGQTVARGQKIGAMGNTGEVYPVPSSYNPYGGTHLHFGVRVGAPYGNHINPLGLF